MQIASNVLPVVFQCVFSYTNRLHMHEQVMKPNGSMNNYRQRFSLSVGFPGGSGVKNLPVLQENGFDPWVGKVPWRREWQPTPVFLPGESHGWRSLGGYNPHIPK